MDINSVQSKANNRESSQSYEPYSEIHGLVKNEILGVSVANETSNNILEYILFTIENKTKKYYITTPNPEFLVYANKNPQFKKILNESEIALCDGVGILIGGMVLGRPFKERITGIDFMIRLCRAVSRKPITVGFLGGRQGVAELTAECLQKKFPTLEVVFYAEEWPSNQPQKDIDILFVAFGHPKQELWMSKNIHKLPVKVMMGVGGAFDFISGRVPRAPLWVRNAGFEWLYRLIQEPWRWKRQIFLLVFVILLLREKFFEK